jgi:hypothetical protein
MRAKVPAEVNDDVTAPTDAETLDTAGTWTWMGGSGT